MTTNPKSTAALAPILEGSATAPILMFDEVPVFGLNEDVGRLTLSAHVQDLSPDGQATMRKVVVAHLRGSATAFRMLRAALDGIEHLAAGPPPPGETKN